MCKSNTLQTNGEESVQLTPTPNTGISSPANMRSVFIPIGTDINLLGITKHSEVLRKLLEQVQHVDFRTLTALDEDEKLTRKHYAVFVVEEILALAKNNRWGIGIKNERVYIYNGIYWKSSESAEIQRFLGEAAEKMGVPVIDSRFCAFRELLYKQFISAAHLPTPERDEDKVLINFQNGTLEISADIQELRAHDAGDFITYVLPFDYDPNAIAMQFQRYLDHVLPDKDCQYILSEYMGSVFIHPSKLKLEKCLLLHGSGANGKSVFFEIINALLGRENVSNFSLQNLTKHDGYQRAELENKLVNYASELNGKLEADIFKQLVSGEPVEARRIYGAPFSMTRYAKMIFNCNELPRDIEHSHAFFRRFLIVPFQVTIAEEDQDKELSKKIIDKELSGVFNWMLEGLRRLLTQKKFTESELVKNEVDQYKKQSDSVQMFMEEAGYSPSIDQKKALQFLYEEYKLYCKDSGCHPVSRRNFSQRLAKAGYHNTRIGAGTFIFAEKNL